MKNPLFLVLTASVAIASAAPVTIELPPETATFKAITLTLPVTDGPNKLVAGAQLAQGNCITCHSPDYLSMQPPMARAFWEAEVKKMIEKYGAPIPAEATASITDYLTATYGVRDASKP